MSVNDITGDPIRTDVPSDKYRSGWDNIFSARAKAYAEATRDEFTQRIANAKFPENFEGGVLAGPIALTRCAANRDGECSHKQCPQLRDNEPHSTGRHCPIDVEVDYD